MTIKAKRDFRVVLPGSAYPVTIRKEDDLEPGSIEARAALDLDLLSAKEAKAVRAALEIPDASGDQTDAGTAGGKAESGAPENKSDGPQN